MPPVPGLAGDSTAQRIAAWGAESSDDEPPRTTTASAPAQRKLRKALFGATAGSASFSAGGPSSVKKATAAALLQEFSKGNLRPERPEAVKMRRGKRWFCPLCRLVEEDGSAGPLCHPIKRDPRAGKPKKGASRKPSGEDFKEWDDKALQTHLALVHGFPPKKRKCGQLPFIKEGAGRGGNAPPPWCGKISGMKSHPEQRRWRFRFGLGFQIDIVRVG